MTDETISITLRREVQRIPRNWTNNALFDLIFFSHSSAQNSRRTDDRPSIFEPYRFRPDDGTNNRRRAINVQSVCVQITHSVPINGLVGRPIAATIIALSIRFLRLPSDHRIDSICPTVAHRTVTD
jgi:hypothetical protein